MSDITTSSAGERSVQAQTYVWVACQNHGWDGMGEPKAAFTNQRDAELFAKLMVEHGRYQVFKVQVLVLKPAGEQA